MLIAWHSATIRTRSTSRAWPESCRQLPMIFAELEAKAEKALPPSVWSYVAGGAGDERTQRANCEAFEQLGI